MVLQTTYCFSFPLFLNLGVDEAVNLNFLIAKLFSSTNSLLSEEKPERNSSLRSDKYLARSDSFSDGITTTKI